MVGLLMFFLIMLGVEEMEFDTSFAITSVVLLPLMPLCDRADKKIIIKPYDS